MHLLLVRHGQTDENARGILQGQSQTALNATGHAQARQLADRLRTYVPRAEAVVSSDLARARQTAEAIAASLGLTVLRNILNLFGDGRLRLVDRHPVPASVPIVNCSIMHLEAERHDSQEIAWRVHAVNDTGHLEEAAAFRVEE
jgi:bisphosphoglycerate-dependent phosphoglycerate mutase